MSENLEVFISVDIEASGPIPGEYSLLSIGACSVFKPDITFSCELKPISDNFIDKAMEVTGLSLEKLMRDGLEPSVAMANFRDWIESVSSKATTPIFVGLNAAFDWSFTNYYFHKFLGENPFGIAPLDIKALYMGVSKCSWMDTKSSKINENLRPKQKGNHDALQDAIYQAELFRLIREG